MKEWQKLFPRSYFQTFPDDKEHGKTVCKPLSEATEKEARELNEMGSGIYFSPNGFSSYKGRNEKFCDQLNWWFVDIEGYPKKDQVKRIKSFNLKPTIVIETKNGYHCYWKIDGLSANWYKVIDNLIEYFGSDMAISSLNEVLRIPGYMHLKDPSDPFEIKLVSRNDNSYKESEMLELCPQKSTIQKLSDQVLGSEFEDDLDKIKEIPIRSVLDKLGVQHERNIIYENGKKTSASIHPKENYIHRFSGKPGSGSVIDAVIAWGKESDTSGAIQWLRQEFGIARQKLREKAEKPLYRQIFKDGSELVTSVMRQSQELCKEDIIRFHIPLLNERMGGIFPSALTIIGADTGVGKSQFLSDLAYYACEQGKKIAYFDLENDDGDFVRRQVARLASIKTGRNITVNNIKLINSLDENTINVVGDCFEEVSDTIEGQLFMYNNHKIPTMEDFLTAIDAIKEAKGVDLILVDHLHYFEMQDRELMSTQLGRIMRALRTLAKETNIPIVLASHLKQRANKASPDNNDLFGSSNIAKESENVILFWKKEDITSMYLSKNRSGGGTTFTVEGVFDPISRQIDFDLSFNQ